jgi:hypothetical protein
MEGLMRQRMEIFSAWRCKLIPEKQIPGSSKEQPGAMKPSTIAILSTTMMTTNSQLEHDRLLLQ